MPQKLAALAELGLDVGINYRTENFADAVLAATDGRGVDVIIDHVGAVSCGQSAVHGPAWPPGKCWTAWGWQGRIRPGCAGPEASAIFGVTFRTRTLDERIAIAQRFTADLLQALADGRLRPLIDRVFPLPEALAAQTYLASNAQVGKIVLMV